MEITKEVFFNFLKENNFYEGWLEGYHLDNAIWNDIIPLDTFFETTSPHIWLYNGPSSMAMYSLVPGDYENLSKEFKKHYDEWRDKYNSLYMELDEKWMSFVHNNQ